MQKTMAELRAAKDGDNACVHAARPGGLSSRNSHKQQQHAGVGHVQDNAVFDAVY